MSTVILRYTAYPLHLLHTRALLRLGALLLLSDLPLARRQHLFRFVTGQARLAQGAQGVFPAPPRHLCLPGFERRELLGRRFDCLAVLFEVRGSPLRGAGWGWGAGVGGRCLLRNKKNPVSVVGV